MCGILAIARSIARPWSQAEFSRFDAAMRVLARRGPDGQGTLDALPDQVRFGHTRLAIQDLSSASAQPMRVVDPRSGRAIVLTYNGELYNLAQLRALLALSDIRPRTTGDTELLALSLLHFGLERTLSVIHGMFAFVAQETSLTPPPTIIAAVDHVGMKPLCGSFDPLGQSPDGISLGPTLTLSSTLDALTSALPSRPALNHIALCHILASGYSPPGQSVYHNTFTLPPGSALRWTIGDPNPPRIWTHWSPPMPADAASPALSTSSPDQPDPEFEHLFNTIVREHLAGDVDPAFLLSAGIDSTSIALAVHSAGSRAHCRAFTLSTGSPTDESSDAAESARLLGLDHHTVPIETSSLPDLIDLAARAFDQPQGYTALLTMSAIARTIASSPGRPKYLLTGDGGDEALAGYAWHFDSPRHPLSLVAYDNPELQPALHKAAQEHALIAPTLARPDTPPETRAHACTLLGSLSYVHRYQRRTFGGFHPREAAALLAPLASTSNPALAFDEHSSSSWLALRDVASLPHPLRAQRLDLLAFCAGSILPKVDRACMHHALELRCPLLDRRILQWSLSRPAPREATSAHSKPHLRTMLRAAQSRNLISPAILSRPKQGFSFHALADDPAPLEALAGRIDSSPLIRDGLLRPDWRSFLTLDAESRGVRIFSLAMLAAWHAHRA